MMVTLLTNTSRRSPSPTARRRRRAGATVALACALTGAGAVAQSPSDRGAEISSELRLSVERGLRHLIRKQTRSGDVDSEYPVAVNALAGLAFLSGGFTAETGPEQYRAAMRRLTDALLRRQLPSGYFNDGRSVMYGHGFATLYLAELYGTTGGSEERVQNALRAAVKLIERSQGTDGGWDYCPTGECERSWGGSDTSITVCQTMALRAARNLGIAIDLGVLRAARRFIERAQNGDGGFRYRFATRNTELPFGLLSGSEFPRSAAGVCILYSLGEYDSPRIRDGFRYLERHYRERNLFPYYGHYYCAQAMFQAGGRAWREYFDFVRAELLSIQKTDGGWRSKSERENDAQATAMALIVLQLPYRLLPIHER